jgi:hypothetical protein
MPDTRGPSYVIPKAYARLKLSALKNFGALGLHIRCIKCGHATPWPWAWLTKAYPNVMDDYLEYFAARLQCRLCRSPRIGVAPYKELPVKAEDW